MPPAAKPLSPAPILFGRGPLPWLIPAVLTGALVPLAALALAVSRGALGANPIAEALNQLGLLALIFLLASLACTPIKLLTGHTWPIRIRKTLGLLAFFYACLHFVTYAVLDQSLAIRAILTDIGKRPFIMVGFAALVILIPLAVTSTANMRKRLGAARWTRLHKLAYAAAILGIVHFVLRVKKDLREPVVYGAVLGALFLVRIVERVRKRG